MKIKNVNLFLISMFFIGLTRLQAQTLKDFDGNTYNTVSIGAQTWMKENLKVTHFRNGDLIPNITDSTEWLKLTTPGYCYYNNDDAPTYKNTYGALYNWYTVNTGNLCPTGWHAPTDGEWTYLTEYLAGAKVAGGKLKETGVIHWNKPNDGATNETGFTALPGGYRDFFTGSFVTIGDEGFWWSSSELDATIAWCRELYYNSGFINKNMGFELSGFSVRCVKD